MGFLELRRQCGVSHEVGRGAQGASRVPDYSESPTYQRILLHLEIRFVHKSNKVSLGT